jgi:hypothetical protein
LTAEEPSTRTTGKAVLDASLPFLLSATDAATIAELSAALAVARIAAAALAAARRHGRDERGQRADDTLDSHIVVGGGKARPRSARQPRAAALSRDSGAAIATGFARLAVVQRRLRRGSLSADVDVRDARRRRAVVSVQASATRPPPPRSCASANAPIAATQDRSASQRQLRAGCAAPAPEGCAFSSMGTPFPFVSASWDRFLCKPTLRR